MGQILTLKSQKNLQIVIKFFSLNINAYFYNQISNFLKSDELFNDMMK